ncbi:MAG: hypothetical protein JNL39_11125 [Opitutaceae bacterium]|nr:hypothetical protein [Opitutaceae bacterium]
MNVPRFAGAMTAVAAAVALVLALRQTPAAKSPAPAGSSTAPNNSPPNGAPADPAVCLPAGVEPTGTFASAVTAQRRREEALTRVRAFDDWLVAWRRADAAAQSSLPAAGETIARERRAALKHLIETDPRRALDAAVPVGLRAELPPGVQALLERRLDERGRLDVSISHAGAEARIDREARIGDETLLAYVFGRREHQQTKHGLPLHGIAVDGAFAVAEEPFRRLDDAEKIARGLTPDAAAVLVGTRLVVSPDHASLAEIERELLAAEARPGPMVAELRSGWPAHEPAAPATAALTRPAEWINGAKRVLWLKIDFSDDPGASHTDAEVQAGATANNDFYAANSQGRTTFAATILPQVLRMPRPKSYYEASGSTNGELYTAAFNAAKAYDAANGATGAFDPDRFDRYVVLHKRIATYLYGGVAQLGGPRVGLNNAAGGSIIAHELGHTQSLAHSHYWLPSGASAVGAGAHVEYGDVFDVMGGGFLHFNVSQKSKLGYLEGTAIATVTASGTHRLNRHDEAAAAGLRALRIAPADLGYEYWIEHRRVAPSQFNSAQTDRLRNGVIVHWGAEKSPRFTSGQGTYLVDATPGSAGGANDAPVRLGETFVDPDAGITIKPLAVGGTAPTEYIDVQVSFGAVDGNRNPTLIADAPAGPLIARSNIIFNAGGADPDGDPVYFRWDFGDGSSEPNLPSITRRFSKGGAYSLRVSSHDGKGGIATKNLVLNVSDPLTAWTQRTSSLTNNLYAAIYAGGKFVVAGDNGANLSSADGITWTRGSGMPNSHFPRSLAHNGARFVAVGLGAANATVRATSAYSNDGVTWTAGTVAPSTGTMTAVAFGVGRFVAVGETGRIYNSIDGAAWTEVISPVSASLSAVAFADNLFVATGASGRILTSADGITWVNRSVTTGNTINAVARHNGQWFAAVSAFECFVSSDGAAWTRVSTAGRTNSNNGQRLVSAAGVLLSSTNAGGITFAEDPRTWSEHQINATAATTLHGLAEGAGQIVIVGVRGLIYTAAAVPASPRLPAPALRLEADSIKVAVGKKNFLAVSGSGFVRVELYANGSKVSEINGASGALTWTPATLGNYLLTVRGVDATGASVVSAAYAAVAGVDDWRWIGPRPAGVDFRGAVRAEGRWWIVGGGGTLLTLDDNGSFSQIDFPTTQVLNGIAYANGRFVIATTDQDQATKEDIGGLWTSPDGYTWTPFLTGALDSANLNAVLFTGSRWLGFGTGGTIVSSTDGVTWPRVSSGVTASLNSAAAGAGLIVAVGGGGQIITSPDGATWTPRTSGVTTQLQRVAFGKGVFVAVGAGGVILRSPDGITWTPATSGVTTTLNAVALVADAFVAGGESGVLLTSADGAAWAPVALAGGVRPSTVFLAGEATGGLLCGRNGEVHVGASATLWTRRSAGTTENRQAVAFGGGRFVAVGANIDPLTGTTQGSAQASADGITWTRAPLASPLVPSLGAVAFAQGRFVAVGTNTIGADRVNNTADDSAAFTSADGLAWTPAVTGAGVAQLTAVAASPSLFVAAGTGGALLTSPDGAAWSRRTSGVTTSLRGAAFGNGRFVVVGDGAVIRHSADGLTWTAVNAGLATNIQLNAVGWWEDVGFIAVGLAGTILSSTDGISWQQRESGVLDPIYSVVRTPIGFVAGAGSFGTLLVSLDGISWSLSAIPVDRIIRGLAASGSTIVAAGDGGALLAFDLGESGAPPIIVAEPESRAGQPGETVRFSVSAQNAAGAVYQWFKDGVPLPGANNPVYTITAANATHAGTYMVTVTAPSGTVTSRAANLVFGASADPGRLINLSILTALTGPADNFSFGVVVGGAGTVGSKPLLVRAVGPSLAPLGVTGVLDDPRLEFFTGQTQVGANDNWGGAVATGNAMAQVGAFAFAGPTSRDAAILLPSLGGGANSARISGTGAGTVLAELYDATPSAQFTEATPRLINVSVLKGLGAGVTAGFVLGGSTARKILVRAIGPALAGFGVGGTVADPRLTLFSGQNQIGANDNWGGTAELTAAFAQVGAFALANDSRDAALLANLQPGAYTVQVAGVGGTGIALVEVYEVP